MPTREEARKRLLSRALVVAQKSPEEKSKFLDSLDIEDLEILQYEWEFWARKEQLEPDPEECIATNCQCGGNWIHWLVMAGRGFGKLISLDCPIPGPAGWTTMGALQVGDEVFDEQGRPTAVTWVSDVEIVEAYRLTFSDGAELLACIDHQWVTWTHAERKAFLRSPYEDTSRMPDNWPAWRLRKIIGPNPNRSREPRVYPDSPGPRIRTTEDLLGSLAYGNRGDPNHCIPVTGHLQLPHLDLPIDPYILGYWLGDGSRDSGWITCHPDDQPHLYRALADYQPHNPPKAHANTVATYGLYVKLRDLGVLSTKHVPTPYLRSSATQRLALLQGLMDSDGHAGKNNHVEFVSVDEHLADAVVELARSLGQKPIKSKGRAFLHGVEYRPKYRVTWRPTIDVFRLPRKRDRISHNQPQSFRNHHRMITDIQATGVHVPMRCITVDSPNSMYLAGEAMIPTHNTRMGAEWVHKMVREGTYKRFHIVGATAADIRDIMIEGPSGLIPTSPPWFRAQYRPTKRRVEWPNGAVALAFSADEPERLRGEQCDAAWADELAAWRYPDAWTQLMLGLRLGTNPRAVITTTPRPTRLIRDLYTAKTSHVTHGSTYNNLANLAATFTQEIVRVYEGQRLGRQELHGELLFDLEGALWNRDLIEQYRIQKADFDSRKMKRVVIAVDPAMSYSDDSAETGIVVCGLGADDEGYVIADLSGKLRIEDWARRAINAYHEYKADRIVAEKNQGVEIVENLIRQYDPDVPIKTVWASRGKYTRAEPVAGLYEQGRIHHVGFFPALEDQLCGWEPGFDSPDRLDALVWGFSELMVRSRLARLGQLSLDKDLTRSSYWRGIA